MKHSLDELRAIAYAHYPKAPWYVEPEGAEETERLWAARARAVEAYGTWRSMLARLREQLPTCEVLDLSMHLVAPRGYEAGYQAQLTTLEIPRHVGTHAVGLVVSAIVPYYVLYVSRSFFVPGTAGTRRAYEPEGYIPKDHSTPAELTFERTPADEPYMRALAGEIEATYGYEPLPPEVGNEILPDVCGNTRPLGKFTLYNAFFTASW